MNEEIKEFEFENYKCNCKDNDFFAGWFVIDNYCHQCGGVIE